MPRTRSQRYRFFRADRGGRSPRSIQKCDWCLKPVGSLVAGLTAGPASVRDFHILNSDPFLTRQNGGNDFSAKSVRVPDQSVCRMKPQLYRALTGEPTSIERTGSSHRNRQKNRQPDPAALGERSAARVLDCRLMGRLKAGLQIKSPAASGKHAGKADSQGVANPAAGLCWRQVAARVANSWASRLRATWSRRLMVPTGDWNSSLIWIRLWPRK